MSSDVYTDGSSSYRICTAECACGWDQDNQWCGTPYDICSDAVVNDTSPLDYCRWSARNMSTEPQVSPEPDKCHCYWSGYGCYASCLYFNISENGWDYCRNGDYSNDTCAALPTWTDPTVTNESECSDKSAWLVPDGIRHVYWCSLSISSIIIPSIMNNIIQLYRLLKGDKYKGLFKAAGISCLCDQKNIARCCLIIAATCQVLPFISLGVNIVILMRNYLNYSNKDVNGESLEMDEINTNEDVGDESLEMNEINTNEDVDDESIEMDLSSMTKQTSLLYAVTEDIPQFTIQSLFFARAAAGVNDGITGGLNFNAIAGIVTSAISLSKAYTVHYASNIPQDSSSLLLLFRTFTTAFMATGGRVLTSCYFGTWLYGYNSSWALIPIGTSILIVIPPYIIQLCYSCYGKKTQEDTSTGNTNVHNDDQSQSNTNKVKALAVILFAGLRSLIFTVTMDGTSIYGLWVSAHFVYYALVNHSNHYYTTTAQTMALTLLIITLSSYVCNSLVLLANAKYRIQSLLVSILLLVGYLFTYVRNIVQYYVTVSILGVVILLNVISLVMVWVKLIMACVKARSPEQETT